MLIANSLNARSLWHESRLICIVLMENSHTMSTYLKTFWWPGGLYVVYNDRGIALKVIWEQNIQFDSFPRNCTSC